MVPFKKRHIGSTQNRDTVPAASPLAPRGGKKSGEYGGRQRHRISSITHGRGTSCDHNVHVVSYLARVDLLCSTPAASKSVPVRYLIGRFPMMLGDAVHRKTTMPWRRSIAAQSGSAGGASRPRSTPLPSRSDKCPSTGARNGGQDRASGERSSRSLDHREHARSSRRGASRTIRRRR